MDELSFEEHYTELGRALSAWGRIESVLSNIFSNAVNPFNGHPSNHAFWAIHSFQQKLTATDKVVRATLTHHQEIEHTWMKLKDRLNRQNKTRNKLAHGTVIRMNYTFEENWEEDTFFAPFHYARNSTDETTLEQLMDSRYDPRSKDRLYVSDLKKVSQNFYRLARDLDDFSQQYWDMRRASTK